MNSRNCGYCQACGAGNYDACTTFPVAVQEEGDAWQPIATAPKTSRAILVWCPANKNIYAVSWRNENGGAWHFFGGGWSLTEKPTHWMPLPKPPGDQP